jgi:biotin transporter BioY
MKGGGKLKVRQLTFAALFAALTAAAAFLRIPLGPVAVTPQFLITAMAGVMLGAKWGAVSHGLYVALGLVGLPLFTMGGGFSYVLQPTFGFLLGLIAAAAVIGGIGSIPGAMLGGILLGVVECISYKITAIAPYTDAIEFSILILILLVRPTGFLGKKRREKV